MSELTLERLNEMTKKEVKAISFAVIDKFLETKRSSPFEPHDPPEPGALQARDVYDRLVALFHGDAEPHVEAFNAAYAADPTALVPKLVEALGAEHGFVVVRVWSRLTQQGMENIEKAKWAHKNLAWLILSFFFPDKFTAKGPIVQ